MKHSFIGTEHILLGLMREKTGNAAKALKSVGVKLTDTRLAAQNIAGQEQSSLPEELTYNAAAKRLLGAAVQSAQNFDVDYIATEYMLLGLLADRSDENCGLKLLKHFAVDLFDLKEQISRITVQENMLYRRSPTERPVKR